MKIAFDAKRALNNSSGLGNYSRNLLNALTFYFPENEYLLFTPAARDIFLNELGGSFRLLFPEKKIQQMFQSLWRSWGIKKDLAKHRATVYHGLSNEIPFRLNRMAKVVTIHDLIFLKHKEQYSFADRSIYEIKTRYAAKHADKIIAVSRQTKNDLIELYQVPEEKIVVIPPLISNYFTKPAMRRGTIAGYQLPAKYILNVASFHPRKNHKTLIEAFDIIKDTVEEHLVLVGGTGGMKTEIELLVDKKKLRHRVHILSNVPNEDLPFIFQHAEIFVFPSQYEGFGMPIVEALLSQVPVITTQGGCFEEAGGDHSVYIHPNATEEIATSILKVLGDNELRTKMITAGLAHAQTMSAKVIAENTMGVYSLLIA